MSDLKSPDLHTPPSKSGDHLVRNVATARSGEMVEAVRQRLIGEVFGCLENVHLLDASGCLIGLVPLTRLVAAPDGERIDELVDADLLVVGPELDQERLLTRAARHATTAPAVVDAEGRLLGCVPPRALVEIGQREHAEDMNRLAGILHSGGTGRHALDAPPWRRALRRLPWLLVGLLGSAAATLVVARFEERLAAQVAVAFFIPAIVYLADAIGTQTEAVVVRGLAFNTPRLARLLAGELAAGAIIGGALAGLTLPLVYLGFGDVPLAVAVAASVFIAGSIAAACGLIFPWLLWRLGLDPAFGSGPVATVVQDVLSLLVYFAAVWLVVPA
jgi:magnesium transporter